MNIKKIIAFVLVIATMATVCITLISCTVNDDFKTTDNISVNNETKPLSVSDFKSEISSDNGVMLLSASPMVMAANSNYIEQTLTATVLPATASNKTVDWSVSWADSSNTVNVTDYVTVTPKTNGSNVCTVTCKKAFNGNIIITVTTRESGYTAECIVSYVGKPTAIIVTSELEEQSDGYHVGIGNPYTFNVELTNPLGAVGSTYNDISVEVSGVGSMVLGYYEYYVSEGTKNWVDSFDVTVTLDSLKSKFITANYADGVLTINTLKNIESYYESMQRLDGGRTRAYTNAFRSYASECYFTVKITEKTSGISETIRINFDDSVVTSVTVNLAELEF